RKDICVVEDDVEDRLASTEDPADFPKLLHELLLIRDEATGRVIGLQPECGRAKRNREPCHCCQDGTWMGQDPQCRTRPHRHACQSSALQDWGSDGQTRWALRTGIYAGAYTITPLDAVASLRASV